MNELQPMWKTLNYSDEIVELLENEPVEATPWGITMWILIAILLAAYIFDSAFKGKFRRKND